MKVVVAPNALKGSLASVQAAKAMAAGVLGVLPGCEVVQKPVADGGDGLIDVLGEVMGGERTKTGVADPLGQRVEAEYLYLPAEKTAIIEMARASGLALLAPGELDPLKTSSVGTGELARHAIERGAKKLIVGIGGSAANDGGMGFAAALGAKFLDRDGRELDPTGGNLSRVVRIDPSGIPESVRGVAIEAMCDVDNPLCGERGAAVVYGPQKGATPEMVGRLDAGLGNLARRIRENLGKEVRDLPGAGAAGGLGAGLYAFFAATLRPGVDVVMDLVRLDEALAGADLAFTAEGAIDCQTAFGKGPAGVAGRAKKAGVPCIALAGLVAPNIDNLFAIGLDAAFSLCPGPMPLEKAMTDAPSLLKNAAAMVFRTFLAGRKGCEPT
ncbi:MAG: glycerate kinase [Planctomycetota bacterium]|jgi:glycerate kinase|nr:glycerate kinase [Planctomycetota bacterium]